MANILTGIRLLCGLLILFLPYAPSRCFIIYILGGITDAIDGTVARKLGQDSSFGARFDTIADIVFLLSVLIRVITNNWLSTWTIIWAGFILLLKAVTVIVGFIKFKLLVAYHSRLNKLCGFAVFIFPVLLYLTNSHLKNTAALFVCSLATVAAFEELCMVIYKNRFEQK